MSDMAQTAGAEGPDIQTLSFEAAIEQLEAIVSKLESGAVPLAQSIDMYERGAALKMHCEAILKQAQSRVEKIQIAADGAIGTQPVDME